MKDKDKSFDEVIQQIEKLRKDSNKKIPGIRFAAVEKMKGPRGYWRMVNLEACRCDCNDFRRNPSRACGHMKMVKNSQEKGDGILVLPRRDGRKGGRRPSRLL
jgi:hypothetical protein